MIKRVLVLVSGALFCIAALAQQVDVSGKDFESGAGDAKLAQIARQAAAENKALSVTTPSYWQAKVEQKLRAGDPGVTIHMNSGFFENVLVRIVEDKPTASQNARREAEKARSEKTAEEAAKAQEKRAADARAAAAKAAAARRAEANRIAAQKAADEKAKAEQAAAAQARAEKQAAEKAAAAKLAAQKAAADKAAAAKAAAAKAEADRIEGIRNGMLKNLNNGRGADGTLTVPQLQRDDHLYVDGPVRGVVRRSGAQLQFYWLQGDLNLERIELLPAGDGRYTVLRPIEDVANPTLRTRAGGRLLAKVPASGSAERRSLQASYAEGRPIENTIEPNQLRSGDLIYTGKAAAVVVRRSSHDLVRYWLVGDLDLGQVGLIKQGSNAYKVLSDTVK